MKIFISFLLLFSYVFSITLTVPISNTKDDAEERISSGKIKRGSSRLELGFKGSKEQAVGLRFNNILLPKEAIISNAYIQFTVKRVDIGLSNIIIFGESSDNAQKYAKSKYNITNRTETNTSVAWNIPVWNTVGIQGIEQRSPNISSIIQEIIARTGWVSGNALAFILKAGSNCTSSACQRRAESYDGSNANAPLLHIEYTVPLNANLVVDYRFDDCYWLNGAGGVLSDIKDSSLPPFHATSQGNSMLKASPAQLCTAGAFANLGDRGIVDNTSILDTLDKQLSISVWLYPTSFTGWSVAVQKSSDELWNDGFGLIHNQNDGTNITFYINDYTDPNSQVSASLDLNTWNYITAVYDGTQMRIYKNTVLIATQAYTKKIDELNGAVNQAMTIGNDISDILYNDVWEGSIDELKIWDRELNTTEINRIYNNENTGNNYNDSPRICPICDAFVQARVWSFIGVPADFRTTVNKKLDAVLEEFPLGSYGIGSASDGWVVYKRTYSNIDNNSAYAKVTYATDNLSFGQGYWLFSNKDVNWSANNLDKTDYNASNANCVRQPCVEIVLETTNKNFAAPDNDPNDGSGPNRINMLGFVGERPINWADCRIIVNGVAYTPNAAQIAGYIDSQVWQYNAGASTANANGYTTCTDLSPGGCKLEPYKAFWLIVHGISKNKTMKLLLPKD